MGSWPGVWAEFQCRVVCHPPRMWKNTKQGQAKNPKANGITSETDQEHGLESCRIPRAKSNYIVIFANIDLMYVNIFSLTVKHSLKTMVANNGR